MASKKIPLDRNHLQHVYPACWGWYTPDDTVASVIEGLPRDPPNGHPSGAPWCGCRVRSNKTYLNGTGTPPFQKGDTATVLGVVDAHPKFGAASLILSWDARVGHGLYLTEGFEVVPTQPTLAPTAP